MKCDFCENEASFELRNLDEKRKQKFCIDCLLAFFKFSLVVKKLIDEVLDEIR